jgi:two-component system, OmpR family, response regulator
MRVLIAEDDASLANTLRKALQEEHCAVDIAPDGDETLHLALAIAYDAIVLDVMMPGIDGWQVLERLRAEGRHTPVLVLTARDGVADRVRGLNLGADDYLCKPFELTELVARLRAMVRRASGNPAPTLTLGPITVDTAAQRVRRGDELVELTAREYAILELLVRRRGTLVSRSAICEHLYAEDDEVLSNVVDVHVAALRRKLGRDLIETRRGQGYIVDA